jgi:putative hydrolase of the HAD superfamily
MVKPMPEIYEAFFKKFSLNREECFFIDDSPANVEASLYVGMPGAVFHNDIRRLRRELRAAGVDIAAE